MKHDVRIYQSDGTDGYGAGCWGYLITAHGLDGDAWSRGGFASAARARAAARAHKRILVCGCEGES